MSLRHFDGAFSGGEMTPELFGRLDLSRYQQGLAMARNFITLPHGPAQNRPGTEYVRAAKSAASASRLIPFSYSNVQTFAIELAAGCVRFHTQGATLMLPDLSAIAAWSSATAYAVGDLAQSSGTAYYCKVAHTNQAVSNPDYWYAISAGAPYEIPSPYAAADLFDIHYTQSADVLTLVHSSYAPMELRRNGATNWTLATVSFAPTIAPPATVTATATVGTGSTTYQYVVTALEAITLTESVSSPTGVSASTITAITKANPGVITTAAAHAFSVGDYVKLTGVNGMTQLNNVIYRINTVPSSTQFTLSLWIANYNPFGGGGGGFWYPIDTTSYSTYTSGGTATRTSASGDPVAAGSGVGTCTNALDTSGNKNTISWAVVPNATRYNVYKYSNGLFGYIGQTSGTSFVDQNITADVSRTPPITDAVMASVNNYPSAVCYFEQRRCFAGTNTQPQNVWMTRSGTEANMNYKIPIADDDRIAFRIAAREASAIKHLVPVTNLLALTPSTEWRISSVTDAITPTTVSIKAQSYIGANNVMPVVVGSSVLFSQARGGRIREMAYDWRASGYNTVDISILVPHLFEYTTITDMAFTRAPYPVLWCVTAQGGLLGMTYVPEQQISGWHRHDTGAGDCIESVCVVSETPSGAIAAEDMLYLAVRRTVNGASVRYIERLHTRHFETLSDAWFLDCALANFLGGTYTQTGTAFTCTVPTHGLSNGATAKLMFSDSTFDGSYTVTVLDANTFTIVVAGTAALGFGTVSVVVANPVTTVSGLSHLEGRTVSILADGAVMSPRTVVSGAITLDVASTKVIVGLPITADLQTLPLSAQADPAYVQGRTKNVNKVWIRLRDSSGLSAGPAFDTLTEYKQRTTEPYGSPPALVNDEVEIVLDPAWGTSGQVCVRQSNPLPLTLTSMTQEVAIGGG